MKNKTWYRILSALCIAALLLGAVIPGVSAAAEEAQSVTLIVQLLPAGAVKKHSAPGGAAVGQSLRAVKQAQATVQKQIRAINPRAAVGFSYTSAINGFSLKAKYSDIEKIRALDNVKAVYVSQNHERIAEAPAVPFGVENSSVTTQVDLLHEQGYKGEGMLIAIVDSEFDLGSTFLTTEPEDAALLRYASADDVQAVMDETALNANVSAMRAWKNTKVPFEWNYDNMTTDTYSGDFDTIHGSHVAGIAAGKNGVDVDGFPFNGVAPEAQLLCMASASLATDATIAAIDDAIKLGADVLNMSWGYDYAEVDLYEDIFHAAAEAGTMLVCAAGNCSRSWFSPDNPDYGSIGTPHSDETCMSVASSLNTKYYIEESKIQTDKGDTCSASDQNWYAPFLFEEATRYVYCGEMNEKGLDLKGRIAVFDRSDITFEERISLAYEAGAVGVLFLLPEEEDMYEIQIDDDSLIADLPTAIINFGTAEFLRTNGKLTTGSHLSAVVKDAVELSDFTSWGVGSSLTLDPDITAPGGMIWSSVPVEENEKGYTYFSGTSMAAPHITGATALLKQYLLANESAFAEKGAAEQQAEINCRMMSAAQILLEPDEETGLPEEDSLPYSPRVQGAGLLQLDAAAKTPVVLEGDKGRAKCSIGAVGKQFDVRFTAENLSGKAVSYDGVELLLFTENVEEEEDYYILSTVSVPFAAKGLPGKLTVAANDSKKINVSVTPDADMLKQIAEAYVNGFYLDGYVCFTDSTGGNPAISIPFSAFCGDWEAAPVLDGTYWDENAVLGYTRLTSVNGDDYVVDYNGFSTDLISDALGINTDADYAAVLAEMDEEERRESGVTFVGYDPESVYSDPSFGGISPNGDNVYDSLVVDLFPLRKADVVTLKVTDSDGNDLQDALTTEDYKTALAWKCLTDENETVTPYGEPVSLDRLSGNAFELVELIDVSSYGLADAANDEVTDADSNEDIEPIYSYDMLLMPEDNYTVTVTAQFSEKSKKTETLTMDFFVDTWGPELADYAFRQEDGATYLDIHAWDNWFLQSISVQAYPADENEPVNVMVYPSAGEKEAFVTFDLSNADLAAPVTITLNDYAMNETKIDVLPAQLETDGSAELIWDVSQGGDLAFSLHPLSEELVLSADQVSIDDHLFFCLTPNSFTEDGIILPESFLSNLSKPGAYKLTVWSGDYCMSATLNVVASETREVSFGDVDMDGAVTPADARLALRASVQLEALSETQALLADINGDETIGSDDARMILRVSVRLDTLDESQKITVFN